MVGGHLVLCEKNNVAVYQGAASSISLNGETKELWERA
jgi:hypothetical protein